MKINLDEKPKTKPDLAVDNSLVVNKEQQNLIESLYADSLLIKEIYNLKWFYIFDRFEVYNFFHDGQIYIREILTLPTESILKNAFFNFYFFK